MSTRSSPALRATALCAGLALAALPARASDGAIEINQAKAQAGAVNGSLATDPAGFPVVISQPGSYRLTGDLTLPNATLDGIFVSAGADDVTIDLGGFTIRGVNTVTFNASPRTWSCSASGLANGIRSAASHTIVRNGRIRKASRFGVWLDGVGSRAEGLVVDQTCGPGVSLGLGALATLIQARRNTGGGILCAAACRVVDSVADENDGRGIAVGDDSVVSGSIAHGGGSDGITTGSGALVVNSAASRNLGDGIEQGMGSSVLGSVANGNGAFGILTSAPGAFALDTLLGNTSSGQNGTTPTGCSLTGLGVVTCPTP